MAFSKMPLNSENAIKRIVAALEKAESGRAPFVLVLGSGFSFGLVPTTKELVQDCIPLWMKANCDKDAYRSLKQRSDIERRSIAAEFWQNFVGQNLDSGCSLKLDPQTKLPIDFAQAYKDAFSENYLGALPLPVDARKLQRELMQLEKPRLNAAHFFLASILGVQPGGIRDRNLFKTASAFSRLILTTNFDPFLQIALQSVNQLYFMSDTPDLGFGSEIHDSAVDSVHLVYLHGSIHRRKQAASEEEIKELKTKNAQVLKPVLERHGVIVIGYSGWDDVVVDALEACDGFDYGLYWCGREDDPTKPGAFGSRVPEILKKRNAHYVKIDSAGKFMSHLCSRLVGGLPRLIDNPIGQLRELLTNIDLQELKNSTATTSASVTSTTTAGLSQISPTLLATTGIDFHAYKESTLGLLKSAEDYFYATRSQSEAASTEASEIASASGNISALTRGDDVSRARTVVPTSNREIAREIDAEEEECEVGFEIEAMRGSGEQGPAREGTASTAPPPLTPQQKFQLAAFAFSSANYDESLKFCDQLLSEPGQLSLEQECQLRNMRGEMKYFRDELREAIEDWNAIVDRAQAPIAELARALFNRGVAHGELGDTAQEIADYSRLIDSLPTAPTATMARALYNRGSIMGRVENADQAIADFSRVIDDLKDVSIEQLALTLYNRGVAYGWKGDNAQAWSDYSRVIDDLPGAPVDQIATSMGNRAWLSYLKRDYESFYQESVRALQVQPQLGYVAFNIGLALLALGRDREAEEQYRQAASKFPADLATARHDLEQAQKDWLTTDRAQPVLAILKDTK